MSNISFLSDGIEMPEFDRSKVIEWINRVAACYSRSVGDLTYIFCNDEKILEVNKQFLRHDYYTDIITFDYSRPRRISGDIFISLDTVNSNAELFGKSYESEFYRVVIHGVLHLCGINDKGEGEREIMEGCEDAALKLLNEEII